MGRWGGMRATVAEFAFDDYRKRGGEAVDLVFFDPHADLSAYLDGARSLIREHGCRISSAPSPRPPARR